VELVRTNMASGAWTGRIPSPRTSGRRAPPSLSQLREENSDLPPACLRVKGGAERTFPFGKGDASPCVRRRHAGTIGKGMSTVSNRPRGSAALPLKSLEEGLRMKLLAEPLGPRPAPTDRRDFTGECWLDMKDVGEGVSFMFKWVRQGSVIRLGGHHRPLSERSAQKCIGNSRRAKMAQTCLWVTIVPWPLQTRVCVIVSVDTERVCEKVCVCVHVKVRVCATGSRRLVRVIV
jgi:hypothetical protein